MGELLGIAAEPRWVPDPEFRAAPAKHPSLKPYVLEADGRKAVATLEDYRASTSLEAVVLFTCAKFWRLG
jgi:hypothetical protein